MRLKLKPSARFIYATISLILCAAAWGVYQNASHQHTGNAKEQTRDARVASKVHPDLNARKKMSDRERLRHLENLGHVPEDGDWDDFRLAQKASWWGKRLDPKTFWTNRVIWLDESATRAAKSLGRQYPPMPFDDPTIPRVPGEENDWDGAGVMSLEGPNIEYRLTAREGRFWDKFVRTCPKPPEDLHQCQVQLAGQVLRERRDFAAGNPLNKTAQSVRT